MLSFSRVPLSWRDRYLSNSTSPLIYLILGRSLSYSGLWTQDFSNNIQCEQDWESRGITLKRTRSLLGYFFEVDGHCYVQVGLGFRSRLTRASPWKCFISDLLQVMACISFQTVYNQDSYLTLCSYLYLVTFGCSQVSLCLSILVVSRFESNIPGERVIGREIVSDSSPVCFSFCCCCCCSLSFVITVRFQLDQN